MRKKCWRGKDEVSHVYKIIGIALGHTMYVTSMIDYLKWGQRLLEAGDIIKKESVLFCLSAYSKQEAFMLNESLGLWDAFSFKCWKILADVWTHW